MKRSTLLIAMLGTGLILACVITTLAVNSQERDFCQNSPLVIEPGNNNTCDVPSSPLLATGNQPTPTLAPPRPEISLQDGPSSNDVAKGQSVYLKVETNQNEIEVGWASP